jgi:hypothetical protein
MRKLPGVGVEYGTNWVITHILATELSPIDSDRLFEEHIRGCYPETTEVRFMTFDTTHAMKSLDHGATYRWTRDRQNFWEIGGPFDFSEHLESPQLLIDCFSWNYMLP